ncbi:unnamed protein product [Schistocephalus solidus]|uniref:Secreted protein n=1 Tax=Schistocephalus solidus TaxID=70667 RepID=A0A183SST9_SCHSO|nr:unnamed protein product [Schistocephalus solidus]
MVIAELAFPLLLLLLLLLLLEMDNGVVLESLRDLSLAPHSLEERCELVYQLGGAMLVNLSRDRVRSRCFPAGELLQGPDGFWERGQEIEFGVGFHFRQSVDGGVGDGGGLVKNALEVLRLALQDLRLLRHQGSSVSTEKGGMVPLGGGS